jgi:hypothetical protein
MTEQFLGSMDIGPTFGFILTDILEGGFSDEFLAGTTSEDILNQPGIPNANVPRLHISCSFKRDIILARQRGLWPSHNVPCLDLSTNLTVSELMQRTALVHRQRLQSPIDHEPAHTATARARHDGPIRGIVPAQPAQAAPQRRPASPDRRLSEQLEERREGGRPLARRFSQAFAGEAAGPAAGHALADQEPCCAGEPP